MSTDEFITQTMTTLPTSGLASPPSDRNGSYSVSCITTMNLSYLGSSSHWPGRNAIARCINAIILVGLATLFVPAYLSAQIIRLEQGTGQEHLDTILTHPNCIWGASYDLHPRYSFKALNNSAIQASFRDSVNHYYNVLKITFDCVIPAMEDNSDISNILPKYSLRYKVYGEECAESPKRQNADVHPFNRSGGFVLSEVRSQQIDSTFVRRGCPGHLVVVVFESGLPVFSRTYCFCKSTAERDSLYVVVPVMPVALGPRRGQHNYSLAAIAPRTGHDSDPIVRSDLRSAVHRWHRAFDKNRKPLELASPDALMWEPEPVASIEDLASIFRAHNQRAMARRVRTGFNLHIALLDSRTIIPESVRRQSDAVLNRWCDTLKPDELARDSLSIALGRSFGPDGIAPRLGGDVISCDIGLPVPLFPTLGNPDKLGQAYSLISDHYGWQGLTHVSPPGEIKSNLPISQWYLYRFLLQETFGFHLEWDAAAAQQGDRVLTLSLSVFYPPDPEGNWVLNIPNSRGTRPWVSVAGDKETVVREGTTLEILSKQAESISVSIPLDSVDLARLELEHGGSIAHLAYSHESVGPNGTPVLDSGVSIRLRIQVSQFGARVRNNRVVWRLPRKWPEMDPFTSSAQLEPVLPYYLCLFGSDGGRGDSIDLRDLNSGDSNFFPVTTVSTPRGLGEATAQSSLRWRAVKTIGVFTRYMPPASSTETPAILIDVGETYSAPYRGASGHIVAIISFGVLLNALLGCIGFFSPLRQYGKPTANETESPPNEDKKSTADERKTPWWKRHILTLFTLSIIATWMLLYWLTEAVLIISGIIVAVFAVAPFLWPTIRSAIAIAVHRVPFVLLAFFVSPVLMQAAVRVFLPIDMSTPDAAFLTLLVGLFILPLPWFLVPLLNGNPNSGQQLEKFLWRLEGTMSIIVGLLSIYVFLFAVCDDPLIWEPNSKVSMVGLILLGITFVIGYVPAFVNHWRKQPKP